MPCEAVGKASRAAIEQLDRQSAQAVLERCADLKSQAIKAVVEIVHNHTMSHKFEDEEVGSNRVYPPTYRMRPVEAQVTELRKFPCLSSCQEKLGAFRCPRARRLVCRSPLAGTSAHLQ